MNGILETLAIEQMRLVSIEELIVKQMSRGGALISDMTNCSQQLICDLRLLSLVRCKIMKGSCRNVMSILESQTFQGLKFASMQYCPDFVEPNQLNQCQSLVTFFRANCDVLARVLLRYSKLKPSKCHNLAFSCFLALFQQGWCVEEDDLIAKVLLKMADFQRSENAETAFSNNLSGTRKLLYPLSSPQCSLAKLEPFATFVAAYLFNSSSLAYLQSALAPIIIELQSLSHLCEIRNKFVLFRASCVFPVEYWKQICHFALQIYTRLMTCLDLLPPGVFVLFSGLKELGYDLKLVFFEAFINQALDNPAVVGLLPWHPSHEGWHPSCDIANVFRSKFATTLKSKRYSSLVNVLNEFDSYQQINLDLLTDKLAQIRQGPFPAILKESELLLTNPNFPKEMVLSGNTIRILHEAAMAADVGCPQLDSIVQRLKFDVTTGSVMKEHFKMVVIRRSSPCPPIEGRQLSLFARSPSNDLLRHPDDHFAQSLCRVLSRLPAFSILTKSFAPSSLSDFFSKIATLLPLFVPADELLASQVVVWMAKQEACDPSSLVAKISRFAEMRETRVMLITDEVVCLQTQQLAMENALNIVRKMRKNVQSHVLLSVADMLMENNMKGIFAEIMKRCHQYISDVAIFAEDARTVVNSSRKAISQITPNRDCAGAITRIMFFRLAETITFGKYIKTNQVNWKRSIIITKILERHCEQMLNSLYTEHPAIQSKHKYLTQASNMLGHIRNSSGFSAVIHTVFETINIVKTLVANCDDINIDECMTVTLLTSRAKHPFLISKFLQHFLLDSLSDGFLECLFTSDEIVSMSVIPSSVLIILDMCREYDHRISREWMNTDAV